LANEVQKNRAYAKWNDRSWIWTVAARERVCQRMDDDTLDLIRKLCTRAGMIMEDASVDAVTISAEARSIDPGLTRLAHATEAISALVAAARVLSRLADDA
jgi:hypothetical protein